MSVEWISGIPIFGVRTVTALHFQTAEYQIMVNLGVKFNV